MTSLNDLKQMVDNAIEKCHGLPIAEFPILMGSSNTVATKVDIEIKMELRPDSQQYQPTIIIHESDED